MFFDWPKYKLAKYYKAPPKYMIPCYRKGNKLFSQLVLQKNRTLIFLRHKNMVRYVADFYLYLSILLSGLFI